MKRQFRRSTTFGHSAGVTIARNGAGSFARYFGLMNNSAPDRGGQFAVVRDGVLLPSRRHDAVSLGAWSSLAVGGLLCWSVILSLI